MKNNFKRMAAWALALCMCLSCVSGAMAAPVQLEAAEIAVTATANEQSNGNYIANYSAKVTMTESFAIAAITAVEVEKEALKDLDFVCTLSDSLVNQFTVAKEDVTLDSTFFYITDATGGEGNPIVLTYKLVGAVVEGWYNDLTAENGRGRDAVMTDLRKAMTMSIKQSKSVTATQMTTAGSSITGDAVVTVKGNMPANFANYFKTNVQSGDIIAAQKTYDVDINEYRPSSGGGSAITSYAVNVSGAVNGSIKATPSWASSGAKITVTATPNAGYRVTGLKVTDKDGKEVAVTKVSDNTYTFTMPKGRVTVTPVFEKNVADPAVTGVSELLNAEDHIAYMHGDNNGNFRPQANITRAEVAQVFYNLLKEKAGADSATFKDVDANAWYATAVGKLAAMGIVNGVGNDNFQPNRSITRAEFATIAARFAQAATNSFDFNDVSKSHWAYSYISTAASYGWITGTGDNNFEPERAITRAEVATMVNRMLRRLGDAQAASEGHSRDWPDVSESYWAWDEIAEATSEHDHEFNESFTQESWITE